MICKGKWNKHLCMLMIILGTASFLFGLLTFLIGKPEGSHINTLMGMAIDINPLYNPWVRGNKVDPAEGRPYAFNRSKVKAKVPVITINDACYKLFRKHGFTWGGSWRSSKDYQHFEKVQK